MKSTIEKYTKLHEAEQMIEAGDVLEDLKILQQLSNEEKIKQENNWVWTVDNKSNEEKIDENTSDWYHTFKELYAHRIALFIALIKCNPKISWRANNNDDWTNREWRFVAWIHLDSWDITYHLPQDKRTELDWYGITTTLNAPKRDWHTSDDVLNRLKCFEAGQHLTKNIEEKENAETFYLGSE